MEIRDNPRQPNEGVYHTYFKGDIITPDEHIGDALYELEATSRDCNPDVFRQELALQTIKSFSQSGHRDFLPICHGLHQVVRRGLLSFTAADNVIEEQAIDLLSTNYADHHTKPPFKIGGQDFKNAAIAFCQRPKINIIIETSSVIIPTIAASIISPNMNLFNAAAFALVGTCAMGGMIETAVSAKRSRLREAAIADRRKHQSMIIR